MNESEQPIRASMIWRQLPGLVTFVGSTFSNPLNTSRTRASISSLLRLPADEYPAARGTLLSFICHRCNGRVAVRRAALCAPGSILVVGLKSERKIPDIAAVVQVPRVEIENAHKHLAYPLAIQYISSLNYNTLSSRLFWQLRASYPMSRISFIHFCKIHGYYNP
jgi:hypothetical protein